jgi:hypothetical protein
MARKSLHPELQYIDDALSELPLEERQRSALRNRYVRYGQWLEQASARSRLEHYLLRFVAAIGGVVVTALSGLNVNRGEVRWVIFAVALLVASITVDSVYNLEERWLHYRRAAEELKSRLRRFVQIGGSADAHGVEEARVKFVDETERFFREEVDTYIKGPARERQLKRDENP